MASCLNILILRILQIDTYLGALARFGYNLDDDFGPARPSSAEVDGLFKPERKLKHLFGAHIFIGAGDRTIRWESSTAISMGIAE